MSLEKILLELNSLFFLNINQEVLWQPFYSFNNLCCENISGKGFFAIVGIL